jgi:hypothetical protein
MAPSAITPPQGVQQTSELTAAAVAEKLAQTAPGLLKKWVFLVAAVHAIHECCIMEQI